MKAHIVENQNQTPPQNDKELLGSILDLMGQFDAGAENSEFQEIKDLMMNSGITPQGLLGLLGDNLLDYVDSRQPVEVFIQKLTDTATIPTYSHLTDACADIYADEDVVIAPGATHPVSTGIALAIPDGFVVHVYARSGLSVKTPLRLANSVGIIDAGYRDELKVPCWNSGNEPLEIKKGMRIAQMDIIASPIIEFSEVNDVKSIPGDRMGGFGSSGLFEMTDSENNG